jgi:hypothetical protein
MSEPSAEVLRVPAEALPAVIAAHETALRDLGPVLSNLSTAGRIARPWTDDPVAFEITQRFNAYAVDGTDSAYAFLRQYEQRLREVLATLQTAQAAYQAGEATTAAAFRAT